MIEKVLIKNKIKDVRMESEFLEKYLYQVKELKGKVQEKKLENDGSSSDVSEQGSQIDGPTNLNEEKLSITNDEQTNEQEVICEKILNINEG